MNLFNLKSTLAAMVLTSGLALGAGAEVAHAQNYHGDLTHNSPISNRIRPGCHFRIYRVYMNAGCHYHVDLESRDFDTYLYVLGCNGQIVSRDDDGGQGTNSALTFYPQYSGMYEVMVTSFGRDRTGHYHLDIHRH